MKGKIEVLEVQEGWIRTEWGRPDLNRWPPGYQPGAQTMLSYGPFQCILWYRNRVGYNRSKHKKDFSDYAGDNCCAPLTQDVEQVVHISLDVG